MLTEAIPLKAGEVEVQIIYNGEGRFYLVLVNEAGGRTLVADRQGHFNESQRVTVAAGQYRLDIFAGGRWVVNVRQ